MSDQANNSGDPRDDEVLATEYVLGVLDQPERRRCALRMAQEPAFAALVADWEDRLSDLNTDFMEVAPPDAVKRALDRRLFGDAATTDDSGLWSSLRFWRILTGAALAGLAALAVVLVSQPQIRPAETLVAALASNQSDDRFVALYQTATSQLQVIQVAGEARPDRDFEVWLIAGDDPPRSLGLVGGSGERAPAVSAPLRQVFAEGVTLAVSVEPSGGSPAEGPTGPVIAVGQVSRI